MTPILFDKSETTFTSQGLGALSDAISCGVTEERNGSYELEMTYPVGGIHYADIQYGRLILAVPSADAEAEPFEIYKITRPLSGKVKIYAQHVSYRLSYTAVFPTNAQISAQAALDALKASAATDAGFTFYSDVITQGTFVNEKTQSLRSVLGGQTGSILDVFGGEYQWNRWQVNLLTNRGSTHPITLEYGKNITDLKQEEYITNTYTAVLCVWSGTSTNGVTSEVHGDLVRTDTASSFPYVRTKVVDKSQDYHEAPTAEQLTAAAKTYILANDVGVPKVSVKVSFVNLRDTEEYKDVAPLQMIHLCDTITVRFAKLGIDASAKVIATEWDVLNDRYDSIEVGESRSSFASTLTSAYDTLTESGKKMSTAMMEELNRATQVIMGGRGGYVVIRKNEGTGYPDEILVMDQPDRDTAKNVIRFNKNGIGFSQNGYNGPFNSAWMIDGTFDATQIKAGKLSDFAGKFYLDMETGELVMKDGSFQNGTFTDGTIVSKDSGSGDVVTIQNGQISGQDGETGSTVTLKIGDGLFDIIGQLALNGNVGVSGDGSYIKDIDFETRSIVTHKSKLNPTSGWFLTAASLSNGSATLQSGSASLSGGGINYSNPTLQVTKSNITYTNSFGSSSSASVVTDVRLMGGNCTYTSPNINITWPNVNVTWPHLTTYSASAITREADIYETTETFDIPMKDGIHKGTVSSKYGVITTIN